MENIQKKCEIIGKSGCYFLTLLASVGVSDQYVIRYYDVAINKKAMDADCYVKDPATLLKLVTGKNYKVVKSDTLDDKADIIIAKWKTATHEHFVLMNKENQVIYDALGESNTVKNGYIDSYRLFYVQR